MAGTPCRSHWLWSSLVWRDQRGSKHCCAHHWVGGTHHHFVTGKTKTVKGERFGLCRKSLFQVVWEQQGSPRNLWLHIITSNGPSTEQGLQPIPQNPRTEARRLQNFNTAEEWFLSTHLDVEKAFNGLQKSTEFSGRFVIRVPIQLKPCWHSKNHLKQTCVQVFSQINLQFLSLLCTTGKRLWDKYVCEWERKDFIVTPGNGRSTTCARVWIL